MIVLNSAVVGKEAERVVAEVADSARGAFGLLDLQVQRSGRPIGDGGGGEAREDLRPPCVQCSSQAGDFGNWAVAGGGDDCCRGAGVAELVAAHQVLGDGPGGGDLPAPVAGDESGSQPTPGPLGEPVGTAAQDAADPLERGATMNPMARDIVLHAAAHLGQRGPTALWCMGRV